MSVSMEQLFDSPRLKIFSDRITERLREEQAAREKFRNEMNEDTRAEFINGKVLMHSPAKFVHNRVAERIHKLLDRFVDERNLGIVGHEKYLVELTRNDVEPDVVFWKAETAKGFQANQMLFPPPNLVVEVISPSTEAIDRGTKFDDYAAHGVTEYWIVDPDHETLEQYVLNGDGYELKLKSGNGRVRCVAIEGAEFVIEGFFDDELTRQQLRAMK